MANTVLAAAFYSPLHAGEPNVKLQRLSLRGVKEDECLVRIMATGLCHTDLAIAANPQQLFPRVLGHEGTSRDEIQRAEPAPPQSSMIMEAVFEEWFANVYNMRGIYRENWGSCCVSSPRPQRGRSSSSVCTFLFQLYQLQGRIAYLLLPGHEVEFRHLW